MTQFKQDIIAKLIEMRDIGQITSRVCDRAQTVVMQNNTFEDESCMSVSDAASLAVELV